MNGQRPGTTPAATDADQLEHQANTGHEDLARARLREALVAGAMSAPTQAVSDDWFEQLRDRVRRAARKD
jgi:hypothetical protein